MVEITEEKWKETHIEGVSVSNLGRVRRDKDGKLFSISTNKSNGYRYVDLRSYPSGKMTKVARLVALTFLSNPEGKPDVDHINTVRTDDRLDNLRWCTKSENMRNSITQEKMRARRFRENPKRRVPILQYSLDGIFISEWESATSFGKAIGKDVGGNICACIAGRQPSAYGYKWRYKYDKD